MTRRSERAQRRQARLIGDRKAVEAKPKTLDQVVIDHTARLEQWVGLLSQLRGRVDRVFISATTIAPATHRRRSGC